MNKFRQVYAFLFKEYGKQGWWPVIPENECNNLPVYGVESKNNKQKLEIIFGAILTQNTQWKPNVERAISKLNKLNLIDVERILNADHNIIAEAIKSSGYYNQKAKNLKNIAEFLKKHPIKKLADIDLWEARKLLLEVKGIGPETADSILLYAFEKPIFVVDAYTKRIFTNLELIKHDSTYDEVQKLFMDNLRHDTRLFNEYHALLVEHAKNYYQKKEDYLKCPLLKKFK